MRIVRSYELKAVIIKINKIKIKEIRKGFQLKLLTVTCELLTD